MAMHVVAAHLTATSREGRRCLVAVGAFAVVASDDVDAVEVLGGLDQALGHELLAAAERHAGVVVLLVGLLVAVGVADLALQVRAELRLVRAQAVPEGPPGGRGEGGEGEGEGGEGGGGVRRSEGCGGSRC